MIKVNKINELRTALKFTLKWEGNPGYTNDPKDPGGETKYSISKKAHPQLDIKNLTADQASDIYAKEYWLGAGCDDIPYPLNCVVFDTAVNCGVSRAKDWLRKSKDVYEFLDLRKQHYITIVNKEPPMVRFARGWWNRLADLKTFVDVETKNLSV